MNRQSRVVGEEDWTDCGSVTFSEAVTRAAERVKQAHPEIESVKVEVRDADWHGLVWTVDAQVKWTWELLNLRGGE